MLQMPAYNSTGSKLVFTAVSTEGKTIIEIDRQTGSFRQLIPFQTQQLSRPKYADGQIIFRAHYNGIDNIYRLDPESGKIFQITSAQFGAFNPFYDELSNSIVFNNFQATGYDIASIRYNENEGTSISQLENTFINYARPLVLQEGSKNVFDSIPQKTFASKRYRELGNLFYFHSVSLVAEDVALNSEPTLGLQLLSNNKLNTLSFYTGYQYNSALRRSEYLAGFTYKRFYPVLDLRYINRPRLAFTREIVDGQPIFTPVSWTENFTEFRVGIPFLFNQLNKVYSTGLNLSTSHTSRYNIINQPTRFNQVIYFPLKYQFYLNRNVSRSARDLAPLWGQNITISYQHLPLESGAAGDLFSARSLFYAPGLLRNHSFQTRINYQRNSGAYNLVNDIPLVSGYYNLRRNGEVSNTVLLDYRFPLFYPDWELGPLAYIKRIKGGVFADFENLIQNTSVGPRTFGAEIIADMNLLRFYLPNFELTGKIIFVNREPAQNPIFETGLSYNF